MDATGPGLAYDHSLPVVQRSLHVAAGSQLFHELDGGGDWESEALVEPAAVVYRALDRARPRPRQPDGLEPTATSFPPLLGGQPSSEGGCPTNMWADIVKRFNELLDRDPSDLVTAGPEDAAQRAEDGWLDES